MDGDKNFLVGVWGLANDREDLQGDKTAFGIKIDYPNDLWDWFLMYRRIGDAFDPSMGFVARRAINYYSGKVAFMPRPENPVVRQHRLVISPSLYTDLGHQWESYSISFAPINPQLESGDQFEFSIQPQGEYLKVSFEISDGVIIRTGSLPLAAGTGLEARISQQKGHKWKWPAGTLEDFTAAISTRSSCN